MAMTGNDVAKALSALGRRMPEPLRAMVPAALKARLGTALSGKAKREEPDTYIISYHKSGRTWLRVLIGKALSEYYGFSDRDAVSPGKIARRCGIDVIRMTHDGSAALDGKRYWELEPDKSRFTDKKVIFLARDVRDLIVSSYHALTKRDQVFEGDISEFIRSDIFGIRRILQFYNIWSQNRGVPKDFLLISYEEFHKEPEESLRRVLDFIGAGDVGDEYIKGAVAFSSFENMQKMEQSDFFQTDLLRPKDPGDKNSFKVRRGIVGSYKDELSESDIAYLDSVIEEMGDPFAQQ